jgi:uncharacterized protein
MMFGELSPAETEAILTSERFAHLACTRDGQPYVVPIAYAYDGEAIYVHSLRGSKIEIMRANPRVCVQMGQVEHMTSWRSVVLFGEYEELKGDAARAALRRLTARLIPNPPPGVSDPFAPPGLEQQAVLFRIRIRERTGRFVRP